MDTPSTTSKRALKFLSIAEHMLTQTYPLVNDPKLLIVIMENIFLSISNSITAALDIDGIKYSHSDDHSDTENFNAKLDSFRRKLMKEYQISADEMAFIDDVSETISEHKKSPVEFVRKDTFVICSKNYKISAIRLQDMALFISKAKTFINKVDALIDGKQGV